MNDKNEFTNEVISLYDEWIRKEENRGISYGEISYLQNLKKKELKSKSQLRLFILAGGKHGKN